MNFSTTVTVPESRPDQARALWEQLVQDGFTNDELHIPPLSSKPFAILLEDARLFTVEVGGCTALAWPLKCERWLNRLSSVLTGKLFADHPMIKRRAICHAAVMLAGRPELLP